MSGSDDSSDHPHAHRPSILEGDAVPPLRLVDFVVTNPRFAVVRAGVLGYDLFPNSSRLAWSSEDARKWQLDKYHAEIRARVLACHYYAQALATVETYCGGAFDDFLPHRTWPLEVLRLDPSLPTYARDVLEHIAIELSNPDAWAGLASASLTLRLFVQDVDLRQELAATLLMDIRSDLTNTLDPTAAFVNANKYCARFSTNLMIDRSLIDGPDIDEDEPVMAPPSAKVVSLKQGKDLGPK